jgi:hypothetical protein
MPRPPRDRPKTTTPEQERIEELPDAWKRFEKAFDTVMKAKPKPAKKPAASHVPSGKRGSSKLA